MRNSDSAYLFTFINICKQVSRFIFDFRPICLLYINNNNKYSYEKYINAKFGISTLSYDYFWKLVSISSISAVFIPPSL